VDFFTLLAIVVVVTAVSENPGMWPWALAGAGIFTVGKLAHKLLDQHHKIKMAEIKALGEQREIEARILLEEDKFLMGKTERSAG